MPRSLLALLVLPGILATALLLAAPAQAQPGKAKPSKPEKASEGEAKETKPTRRTPKRNEKENASGPQDYSSKNFLLHTDLSADEAKDLLSRLETMLTIISRYWGRPNRQTIEMYVVKDIAQWPNGVLPERGLDSIRTGGGVTLATVQTLGGQFVSAKAPVYAIADRGTPQHEAVHAYCYLNFGYTGPVWYSEGMAEMGHYWKEGEKAVRCHEIVAEYIKSSKPKSLNEIINGNETTGDSWQNYAWRWALCHLLANNENYAARFRPLGLDILGKKGTTFEDVYGNMAQEISFEYLFFLQHLDQGFRCDLCSWDWKAKPKLAKGTLPTTATIEAARGWQSSRALLKKGEEYQFAASGNWKTAKGGEERDADGDSDGRGKLVACLFEDYELSAPFELGVYGSFTAPADGHLVVRCQDAWNELADNSGKITLKIQQSGGNRPLPNPKEGKPVRTAERPAP